MPTYREVNFEEHIEAHLNQSCYQSRQSALYDRNLCLISDETLQFIRDTQPDAYQRLERQYGEETPVKLLDRVSKQIERRGVLDVLRKGITDRGCEFKLTYFRPSSGMNPDHQRLYAQNRFSLIRQLHYSQRDEKSLDMTLFLNGLPLVTMELKNSLTGQVVTDAEKAVSDGSGSEGTVVPIQAVSGTLCGGQREGFNDNPLARGRDTLLSVQQGHRKPGESERSQDRLPVGGHSTTR